MMHFAIYLPDWNSLDSVRRSHNNLEGAALVFFALLVGFDALAHLSSDKPRERLFEKIGLCCFAIAVLAEIVAYPYGQRNDALSEQIIGSLDAKAQSALGKSDAAEGKAKDAGAKADEAETKSAGALARAQAAERSLATAESDAAKAQAASSNALNTAAEAKQTAHDARTEADSFEASIAAATVELNRLKTPRSLVNVPEVISKLQAFKGTEYELCVFQDDESIEFTKMVDAALQGAEWKRKTAERVSLGIPAIRVFPNDLPIAACLETGVQVHIRTNEPLAVLQARPAKDQSPTTQAAWALLSALASGIAPPNKNNVGKMITLDPEPREGPLMVSVGKKP